MEVKETFLSVYAADSLVDVVKSDLVQPLCQNSTAAAPLCPNDPGLPKL